MAATYTLRGIPESLWKRVKLYCIYHDTTIKRLIIKLLKEAVSDS